MPKRRQINPATPVAIVTNAAKYSISKGKASSFVIFGKTF